MTLSQADLAAYAAHRDPVRNYDTINILARRMQDLDEEADRLEEAWEQKKKDYAIVRDDQLPSALKEANVGEKGIDVPGVGMVSWKKDVFGSLPSLDKQPENRAAALTWIEVNAPGLLKRKLTAMMPKTSATTITEGQKTDVVNLVTRACPVGAGPGDQVHDPPPAALTVGDLLQAIIKIIVPSTETDIKLDVPHQSLCAWGREKMAAGVDVPYKLLGLTPVDRAKITTPRTSKKGI